MTRLSSILIPVMALALAGPSWGLGLSCRLDVHIDPEKRIVSGTAVFQSAEDGTVGFHTRGLSFLSVDQVPTELSPTPPALELRAGIPVRMTFSAGLDPESSVITDGRAALMMIHGWYPVPDVLCTYRLSADLPVGFTAVSEADEVRVETAGNRAVHRFMFDHPVDRVTIAASDRYVTRQVRVGNISVETFFFEEDAHLAGAYLEHAETFLAMAQENLGEYPFQRFAIVETSFPAGFSFPTYTLLGQAVVNLPFIVKTSLGHEIVHQWFGNSVYIDAAHGNWAEGLTTYLSDHRYAELEGNGAEYRKNLLIKYDAFVHGQEAMALGDFRSSGSRRENAVGYGRAAMAFHSLKRQLGEAVFFEGLRIFIRENQFRESSWLDLQEAFEAASGKRLYREFADWIDRPEVPSLSATGSDVVVEKGQIRFKTRLLQEGEAFRLEVPVTVLYADRKTDHLVRVDGRETEVALELDRLPERIVLDENYDLMRRLSPAEEPPVLARVMGRQDLILVAGFSHRDRYRRLARALEIDDLDVRTHESLTFEEMSTRDLIIGGYDNPLARRLFGDLAVPDDGVRVRMFRHPYRDRGVIALVNAAGTAEVDAASRKLSHYGTWSDVGFSRGRNTVKAEASQENGLLLFERPPQAALKPDSLPTLETLLPELMEKQVVYVGEVHDQVSHHLNQLRVIQAFHEAGLPVAVGMEMFQQPFQPVIDDYLAGRIDERAFLEKSEYFSRWRFDYNLYKPVVDYLKKNAIPLVALNIDAEITRKVARDGIHSLSDDQSADLPASLDFTDQEYEADLALVFGMHQNRPGLSAFDHFKEAQILWDEGMAEAAHRFLVDHPDRRMIVLAGNGHVRRGYGIPARLFRRNSASYAVVVQDEAPEPGIADAVLMTVPVTGAGSPTLGITIDTSGERVAVRAVADNSPAHRAGFEAGDVIRRFGDHPIDDLADLKLNLFFCERGRRYPITLERNGNLVEKEIELF